MSEMLLNFDDAHIRKVTARLIDQLRGPHWFELRKAKPQRTTAQNSYYFGVVLFHVGRAISEAWGETVTKDEAHEFCRHKFLTRPVVNRNTGEEQGCFTRSTADLDVTEFTEYLDQITKFAAEYLNVEIPPATTAREATCQR